jgi:hypothetical protein
MTSLNKICFLLVGVVIEFFLCWQPCVIYAQSTEPQAFYSKYILTPCLQNQYTTFTLTVENSNDKAEGFPPHEYVIYRMPKGKAVVSKTGDNAWFFGRKEFVNVNHRNKEIMVGQKKADTPYSYSYTYYRETFLHDVVRHFIPLVNQILPNQSSFDWFRFDSMHDTVIEGDEYTVLHMIDSSRHTYNEATKEFDIPFAWDVTYYYDNLTESLVRIVATPANMDNNGAADFGTYDIVISITHDDCTEIMKLFDTNDVRYIGYSRHNNTDNLPPSVRRLKATNVDLTNELLDYPIVSFRGDTTSLRREQGWVLLDFWFTGCKPCLRSMQKMASDSAEVSLAWLEEHKVKLMYVNPLAASTESLLPVVDRYGLNRYMYHAKGLTDIFSIKSYPCLVLVNAQKKQLIRIEKLDEVKRVIGH